MLALNSTVCDLTNLLRVEVLPSLAIHVLKEWHDINWINEVNESISDVATIIDIHRKVEKVVLARVESVDSLEKHLLGVLVGNVADHDSGARVLTVKNLFQINGKILVRVVAAALDTMRSASGHVRGNEWVNVI